jgi:hypothetical protein
VITDPVGQGYTLSQVDLAKALGVSTADVSILSKSFKMDKEAGCAVVVRSGPRNRIVNYHQRAIERSRELVRHPPSDLDAAGKSAVTRVRKKMKMGGLQKLPVSTRMPPRRLP